MMRHMTTVLFGMARWLLSWGQWVRWLSYRPQDKSKTHRRTRFSIESLEDRSVP
jgi:hypothetical protein